MVTLALGIGANVAIYSVVSGVLLKPLAYPAADQLVTLLTANTARGTQGRAIDHPDLAVWRDAVDGFDVVGYTGTRPTLTGFADPEVVYGARVTGGLISLLGYQPLNGRALTYLDDVRDGRFAVTLGGENRLRSLEDL